MLADHLGQGDYNLSLLYVGLLVSCGALFAIVAIRTAGLVRVAAIITTASCAGGKTSRMSWTA